jgi:hypothetical protein
MIWFEKALDGSGIDLLPITPAIAISATPRPQELKEKPQKPECALCPRNGRSETAYHSMPTLF